MDIEKIKSATIEDLKLVIKDLKNVKLKTRRHYKFNTKEMTNDKNVERFLQKIKENIDHQKFKYLYTFILTNNISQDSVYNSYKKAKDSKKSGRAYARLNGKSRCLYVGSSKGIVSRIKQHLGFGPKGTYAMQLCHWCDDLNLDIRLNIYAFNKSVSREAFQTFEDGVWKSLKPMLGRQGKK